MSTERVSGAASIILDIVGEKMIPTAVDWILKNEEQTDLGLKTATLVLCNWLRMVNYSRNLNIWIIVMLNGLRNQRKYNLLAEISGKVIVPMFNTLRLPFFREKLMPVVRLILSSNRHTPDIFNQIIPHARNVLEYLEKDPNKLFLQNVVDLISAFMVEFPVCDGSYDELVCFFSKFLPPFSVW